MKTGNILDTIVAQKRIEVSRLGALGVAPSDLAAAVRARGGIRDFVDAIASPKNGAMALIAEVKKASPSAGVICHDFDPVRIAKEYETAGAHCLSVLTDERFFQGSLKYMEEIRKAVRLPLLRKDFIIDARQIREAIDWGADAILLIVSILSDTDLRDLHALAATAGLAVLVEVHDESEMERALSIGARLIGVNNRDLKTFQVDLGTTERLARGFFRNQGTERKFLVAESGIHCADDAARLRRAGAKAILVGESLMRNGDIHEKVKELIGQ
ncbi:MAG: indole-3-glycerol phosphate synthase TrpC [Verrucomicrobia bacterium]|nr:indole-3-glycerol phosphate synthase TrpC [Verrucomicrobiota bacterium]